MTFIRFKNRHEGLNVVPSDEICGIIGIERMPQTGMYVSKTQAEQLVDLLK